VQGERAGGWKWHNKLQKNINTRGEQIHIVPQLLQEQNKI
jgi:hypothetical protein